jgi:integrase
MRLHPHVRRRPKTGIYEYRRVVPPRLRGHLPPVEGFPNKADRSEFTQSLGTRSIPEANRSAAAIDTRVSAAIAAAERRLVQDRAHAHRLDPDRVLPAFDHRHAAQDAAPPPTPVVLDPASVERAFAHWRDAEISRRRLEIFNTAPGIDLSPAASARSDRYAILLFQPEPWRKPPPQYDEAAHALWRAAGVDCPPDWILVNHQGGYIPDFDAHMLAALASQGLRVSPTHPALPRLRPMFGECWRDVVKAERQFRANVFSDANDGDRPAPPAPATPRSPAPAASAPTLIEMFELYNGERKLPLGTEKDYRTQIRRLNEVIGRDLPVSAITKEHVRTFKDKMLRFPDMRALPADMRGLSVPDILARIGDGPTIHRLDAATVNLKCIGMVATVLNYAVNNGFITTNPASGVRAYTPDRGDPKRLLFTTQDLQTIFTSPVYTEEYRPLGGAGEAAYWLPLLGAFTGARLEELGSLHTEDVGREAGVDFLFIHRRHKNASSRRKIPIHPVFFELGFLAYVAERRRADGPRLFPDLRSARTEVTAAWSKWWGRYMDEIGLTDERKNFHSFRHTVKRALRDKGVDKTLRDALLGHTARDVAEQYGIDEDGIGIALPTLAGAMGRLSYPDLDLSHLHGPNTYSASVARP